MDPFPLTPSFSDMDISFLPPELWVEIISFCPISSFFSLAAVSHQFYSLLSLPHVQKYYLDRACVLVHEDQDPSFYHYERDGIKVGPCKYKVDLTRDFVYSADRYKCGFFVDGYKFGEWSSYFADGSKSSLSFYVDGSFISSRKWNLKGNVIIETTPFDLGKRKEIWYTYVTRKKLKKITIIHDKITKTRKLSGYFCCYVGDRLVEDGYLDGIYYHQYITPLCHMYNNIVGEHVYYHDNGAVSSKKNYNFVTHRLEGPFFVYYDDGCLRAKGVIVHGDDESFVHGDVTIYGRDRDIAIIPYVNGKRHGICRVYSDDILIFTGEYTDDMLSGVWSGLVYASAYFVVQLEPLSTIYDQSDDNCIITDFSVDSVYVRAQFLNGLKHGPSFYYSPDSVILLESYYFHGVPLGKHIYRDSSGSVVKTELHLDGVIIREFYMPGCAQPYMETIHKKDGDSEVILMTKRFFDLPSCNVFLDGKEVGFTLGDDVLPDTNYW